MELSSRVLSCKWEALASISKVTRKQTGAPYKTRLYTVARRSQEPEPVSSVRDAHECFETSIEHALRRLYCKDSDMVASSEAGHTLLSFHKTNLSFTVCAGKAA